MTAVPPVVLDACVLANFSLCDLILRLAEVPRLLSRNGPKRSLQRLCVRLSRNLGGRVLLSLISRRSCTPTSERPGSRVYEPLVPFMNNDEKDRHVAAVAVHGGAPLIVTFNLRHFRPEHLEPWNIRAVHPQDFLAELFRQKRTLVVTKLKQQAVDRGRSLPQLLKILSASVPAFTSLVAAAESIG